jgi:uncharacterized protein YndB with AHSA1/START domain
MKENKLTIQIDKPVSEVFTFTINPAKTPLWIDSVAVEETDEIPVKVGTTYRNKGEDTEWNNYKVSRFETNRYFELTSENSDYKVLYTYTDLGGKTELEYFEWVENGELEDPFQQNVLARLKKIIESQ